MAKTTLRVPLAFPQDNRFNEDDKDARLINVFLEKIAGESLQAVKRPGLEIERDYDDEEEDARAIFYWQDHVYAVIGNILYQDGTNIFTINDDDFNGQVDFAEFDTDLLLMKTNNQLFTIGPPPDNIINEVTDEDYPGDTVPGLVVLAGTVFVMNSKAEIYGSDTADPTSWDALNFLTAEQEADEGVALVKHRSLVVALCSRSTEFFYFAGTEPPGSPLSTQRNTFLKIGCASARSVATSMNTLFWVARDDAGHFFVAAAEGTEYKRISSPKEDKQLSETPQIRDREGYVTEGGGHKFYIFHLNDRSIVFNITNSSWTEWRFENTRFLGIDSIRVDNEVFIADDDKLFKFNLTSGNDYGNPINIELRTPLVEPSSAQVGRRNKFLHRLELICDNTGEGKVWVSWSDDDYRTWSAPRCIDLSKRTSLTRCGYFRRRAFRVQTDYDNLTRFRALELYVDVGHYDE